MGTCLLCESNSISNKQVSASRTIYNCPRCGVFVVSDLAEQDVMGKTDEISAYLMSRKLSNAKDTVLISYDKSKLDKDYLQLTVHQIAELFPKSFSGQMDMALMNLGIMSAYPGYAVKVDDLKMAPLFYVRNSSCDALVFLIKSMQHADLLEVNYYNNAYFPCNVTVSPKGWERISELKKGASGEQILFSCPPRSGGEVGTLFNKAAEKLAEELSFRYISSSLEASEAKVTYALAAAVKSATAVVCDITGHPGEAYYAAGLAAGLGKVCLFTCHGSGKAKLHVDSGQYPVIFWETQEDLHLSLLNALKARF